MLLINANPRCLAAYFFDVIAPAIAASKPAPCLQHPKKHHIGNTTYPARLHSEHFRPCLPLPALLASWALLGHLHVRPWWAICTSSLACQLQSAHLETFVSLFSSQLLGTEVACRDLAPSLPSMKTDTLGKQDRCCGCWCPPSVLAVLITPAEVSA